MAGTREHTAKTPLGGVKAFNCRNCGGQVALRAPGQSLTAVCQHCGSVADVTDDNFRVLQKFRSKLKRKPLIPLGSRGEFNGRTWEVVGFIVRKAGGYNYYWEEYLLFNPRYGFRWLLNQYGHWSFTTPLVIFPEDPNSQAFEFEGEHYKQFGAGMAEVNYVLGEFYYEVKKDSVVKTKDWVCQGKMLSLEKDDYGLNWTRSEYIKADAVLKAFDKDLQLPRASGIAPHQPNVFARHLRGMLPIFLVALAALIGMQYVFAPDGEKFAAFIKESAKQGDSLKVTQPFTIEGKTSNISIGLYTASLQNNWFEMEGYLHNLETNTNWGFLISNEYYSGYTDGESWTEGSRRNERIINGIPPGRYELAYTTYFGVPTTATGTNVGHTPEQPYEITVFRGALILSNLWIVLIILTLPIVYLIVRSQMFKRAKWAESG